MTSGLKRFSAHAVSLFCITKLRGVRYTNCSVGLFYKKDNQYKEQIHDGSYVFVVERTRAITRTKCYNLV